MTCAITDAISSAGGVASLARQLGINRASVHEWKKNNRIPANRVIPVEKITGISRHELRPDIYPRESVA